MLELMNTEIISYGSKKELLNDEEDLLKWIDYLSKKELISIKSRFEQEGIKEEDIIVLKAFRTKLHHILDQYMDSNTLNADWHHFLESKIKSAPITYHFADGQLHTVPIGKPIDCLISLIALDALKIIANEEIKYIRKCSNPECILLFFDKTGRKKWCSMKICGNRNKVKRFHEKNAKS